MQNRIGGRGSVSDGSVAATVKLVEMAAVVHKCNKVQINVRFCGRRHRLPVVTGSGMARLDARASLQGAPAL